MLILFCFNGIESVFAQAPVIIPKPGPIVLHLDATGNYQVKLADIATITGAYNALTFSPASFSCADVGPQTIIVNASNTISSDPVARLNFPYGIVSDAAGNLYIADSGNNQIKKITPGGVVTVLAGSGVLGSADGTGITASFDRPWGLAIDATGNVYVADAGGSKVRKITPLGVVSTVAGTGAKGSNDGPASSATFNNPSGVAVDAAGNLYVVDSDNNKIRKISTGGVVSTFAGSGQFSSDDGNGAAAGFYVPHGIAINNNTGYLYVADGNNRIRMISPNADVTTFVGFNSGNNDGTGTAASLYFPISIAIDVTGNLYVTDSNNNEIRKVNVSGFVSTIVGDGTPGSVDGTGKNASINAPIGITLAPDGNLYVTQGPDNRIRKITPALVVTTVQLAGTSGTNTESASRAIDVTVASQPVITSSHQNINLIAYPGCNPSLPDYGQSVTATDNCSTGPVTFTQSPVPGTALTPGTPINVTLTATDASASSANVTFLVNTVSSTSDPLSFTENPTIFAGSGIKLQPIVGPDIIGYSWSPVDGLSDPTIADPIANPASTTTYTLTVTSSGGCTSSVSVTVSVVAQITVPTAFTPNGDGVNDYWNIAHLSEYPSCTVDVFNRGGQLIFHSMGYGKPWAGTYNGSSLPTGTYYYIIDLRNGRQKLSGEVTIVR